MQQAVGDNGRVSPTRCEAAPSFRIPPHHFTCLLAVAICCSCREPGAVILRELGTSAVMSCRSQHVAGQQGHPTAEDRASVPLDNPLLVPTATTVHRFEALLSHLHEFAVSTNVRLVLLVAVPNVSLLPDAQPVSWTERVAGKRDSVGDPLKLNVLPSSPHCMSPISHSTPNGQLGAPLHLTLCFPSAEAVITFRQRKRNQ